MLSFLTSYPPPAAPAIQYSRQISAVHDSPKQHFLAPTREGLKASRAKWRNVACGAQQMASSFPRFLEKNSSSLWLGSGNWYPWQFANWLPQIICRSVYCIYAWFCSIALHRIFVLSLSKRCNSFHLRKQHFLQPFVRPTSPIQVGVTCLIFDMYDRIWANWGQLAVFLTSKQVTRREVPQQNCLIHFDWTYTPGWGYLMICVWYTQCMFASRSGIFGIFTLMDLIQMSTSSKYPKQKKTTMWLIWMQQTWNKDYVCIGGHTDVHIDLNLIYLHFGGVAILMLGCFSIKLWKQHINFPVEGIFWPFSDPNFLKHVLNSGNTEGTNNRNTAKMFGAKINSSSNNVWYI